MEYEKCKKCKEIIFKIKEVSKKDRKLRAKKDMMIANLICSKCGKIYKFPKDKEVLIRKYDKTIKKTQKK